jgi:pyruvate/2-oxoglutarate dehydrogenase complex dihydrolipoamide acyltransferase (E2) component
MLKPNVVFKGPINMNTWRKVAVATWSTTKDPSIYGFVDVDATHMLETIHKFKAMGIRLTPTVFAAKAVAVGISKYPTFNTVLRWGKLYERKDIDIFLQVSTNDGEEENLSGMIIRRADKKTLEEIAVEIAAKAKEIKSGNDPEFQKVKSSMKPFNSWMIARILDFISFFNYGLNLWSPLMGTPRDSLGSAMVTSVGSMGFEYGFAPLVPYSRCPMVMAVGKITEKAVVEHGKIVIKPILPVSVTMDHRHVDGFGASKMFHGFLGFFKHPH